MHGPSFCRTAGVSKLTRKWERCILSVYGFGNCIRYDRSAGMWQMLRVYGVGGKLLKAVQSFYVDSRACILVGKDVSELFPVIVGLRLGCVMSPWFLMYIWMV